MGAPHGNKNASGPHRKRFGRYRSVVSSGKSNLYRRISERLNKAQAKNKSPFVNPAEMTGYHHGFFGGGSTKLTLRKSKRVTPFNRKRV